MNVTYSNLFNAFILSVWVTVPSNAEIIQRPPPPEALLANGVANPLAVDKGPVVFSWALPVIGRCQMQSAYQILVASSPEVIGKDQGDIWDSRKVLSQKSAAVKYQGPALSPVTRYWWNVRVWDQKGNASAYSAAATFDSGLSKADWSAAFIWDGTANTNNFAYYRKTFQLTKKVVSAKVFVSAHNDYLLFLNGHQLGMGPARSNPYTYGQYNAYDITQYLTQGNNGFAAIGHWHGVWKDSGVNTEPAFILEAHITFDDGTSLIVRTDSSWKTLAATPFIETNPTFFGGAGGIRNRAAIQYDARQEPDKWTEPDFDDAAWSQAKVVDRSKFNLYAQLVAQQAEQAELEPVGIVQDANAWLVDFGRCVCGWPKITMRDQKVGDKVRIEYFQLAGTEGPAGWDQYTCKSGTETWKPNIGRHTSFRTLRITGYAGQLKLADVRGVWSYTSADVVGHFNCSSQLLNDIYTMCERSGRQNVQQGVISVDANREQSPWTADCWNIGNGLLYNHRNTMVVDKTIRDYAGEQMPCGDFYSCSPAGIFRIPEWSMYWPMLLWQQYLFSGDEELLKTTVPRLNKFLAWIRTYQDAHTKLINPPDGSWIDGIRISEYAGGDMPSGGFNIATSCQYYENLRIASRIAMVLGKPEEAADFSREADVQKQAINTHLLGGDHYYSRTDRKDSYPLASAWPLRFDLVPEETKPQILKFIRKMENPELGGYGGDAFYNGILRAGGMGDFAVNDLRRYQKMLAGNCTNWEQFDRGEYNHAWTSYPAYLLQKYFSGIQPTSGGFSTFDIKPEIAGLSFCESKVPTIKGTISTRWEKTDANSFVLSVTLPANTKATIYIPAKASSSISESGEPIVKVEGVKFLGMESGKAILSVDSGYYTFVSKW